MEADSYNDLIFGRNSVNWLSSFEACLSLATTGKTTSLECSLCPARLAFFWMLIRLLINGMRSCPRCRDDTRTAWRKSASLDQLREIVYIMPSPRRSLIDLDTLGSQGLRCPCEVHCQQKPNMVLRQVWKCQTTLNI